MKISLLLFCLLWSSLLCGQQYERYKAFSDTVLYSKALGYEKKIQITVPIEYHQGAEGQHYPLIVIFDSQNIRSYQYILRSIDYLTSNEQMPAAVVVGVASSEQYRYGETQLEKSDSSAFGTKNEQFVFEELLPMLRKQYQALDFTLLIGHSRYGYFCSYLLSKHYEEVQAVIALSPVFSQTNSNLLPDLRKIYEGFSRKRHLYYRFGIGSDYPEEFAKIQKLLQKIPAKKKDKIDFKGMLFPEADHNATPGISIAPALYEIFAYWSSQQNIFSRKEQAHTALAALQQNIERHYGSALKFSIGTLNGKGWQFFNEQKYTQAIAAWEQCVEVYPLFSEAYLYIIYAQKELQEDYSATLQKLEESLRLTQLYSAEELAELKEEIKSLKP